MPRNRRAVTTGVITALIYTRVSSDDQRREGISLDQQIAVCRRYAADHSWVIGGEYQDVMSGKRDDRRDYQRLLADVRDLRARGESVAVVVAWLDRFGRRLLERVRCREELKDLGVATHSVHEGGEVPDLTANVLAAVAEEQVRRLGESVSRVWEHAEERGWHLVGRVPWGYRLRDATMEERAIGSPRRVHESDPETSPFVLEAFTRIAAGEALPSVGTWIARLPDAARGGRVLNKAALEGIFRSSIYVARPTRGPDDILARPRGQWEQIIPDELFATVQKALERRRILVPQAKGSYLLTGFLRCPRCGSRVAGGSPDLRHGLLKYRCQAMHRGSAAPDPTCYFGLTARAIDQPVLDAVLQLLDNLNLLQTKGIEREVNAKLRAYQKRDTGAARRRDEALQMIDRGRERLKKAAMLYVDGKIDQGGYESVTSSAKTDIEAAERIVEETRIEPVQILPSIREVLKLVGDWTTIVRSATVPHQRAVLATLITTVVPEKVGHGRFQPVITWTELGESLLEIAEMAA